MIDWKSELPEAVNRSQLETGGDMLISVTDEKDGTRQWQYLQMSFGAFSEECHEVCKAAWPAEAIAEARNRLDKLEAELEKQCEEQ